MDNFYDYYSECWEKRPNHLGFNKASPPNHSWDYFRRALRMPRRFLLKVIQPKKPQGINNLFCLLHEYNYSNGLVLSHIHSISQFIASGYLCTLLSLASLLLCCVVLFSSTVSVFIFLGQKKVSQEWSFNQCKYYSWPLMCMVWRTGIISYQFKCLSSPSSVHVRRVILVDQQNAVSLNLLDDYRASSENFHDFKRFL